MILIISSIIPYVWITCDVEYLSYFVGLLLSSLLLYLNQMHDFANLAHISIAFDLTKFLKLGRVRL